MDLKRRRRAIYTGMSPYFDDDALLAALQLWQDEYSDKPKFAFTEFLIACCTTDELKALRGEILRSIFNAMELPDSMLLEDPLRSVNTKVERFSKHGAAENDADESLNNNTILFISFFESLLAKTHGEEAEAIRAFVAKQSEKLKIAKTNKIALVNWLNHREKKLSLRYDLTTLRQLISFAYIALSEYKGPVKAEQMLTQTTQEVQKIASELQVNLADFL